MTILTLWKNKLPIENTNIKFNSVLVLPAWQKTLSQVKLHPLQQIDHQVHHI